MAKLMVALVVVALLGLIFTPDVGAMNGMTRYRRRRRSRPRFYEDAKKNDNTVHVNYKTQSLQGWK